MEQRSTMQSGSFLENIYIGSLDKAALDSFKIEKESERVRTIVEQFREILREYPPSTIESEGRIPDEMLRKMAESGLFGASIPEAYGGIGLSLWEYLKTIEEMVKVDISVALTSIAHLSIGTKGIVLFGNEFQKQKYLVPAASGKMIFSYALTEPRIGSDAQRIETHAVLSDDGTHYILNGQKTYITNANYAGGLTVFAQMDPAKPGFMGSFIVETSWDGVKIGKDMPKMGLKASSTASIQFKNVRVPVENLLGEPGEGFKIAMTILNYGRLGLGAASIGMMDQSLEDMKKRSSSRIQFQVPIKSFPLIQEKLVRARTHSFVSSAMDDFVVKLLDEAPLANVAIETSHCKLFGTTRAWDTLYNALQVAGGAGYIATQPYEKRMRDFRVATVFEGTTEIHSIYPPVFALRKIARSIRASKTNPASEILFLIKLLFKKTNWPLDFEEREMKKASKIAKANASSIKRMLSLGLILYGRKAFEKQFFLRRITNLSLYLFGLIAVLAKLTAEKKTGTLSKESLNLLRYFVEEAREARKENRRFFDSKKEALNGTVFEDLFHSWKDTPEQDVIGIQATQEAPHSA
jgi:acyl-CoA dehydrogenase family member 9